MELRKASRKKAKIRLGLSAVSGGGKTYSAILIAKGLTGDLSKVAVIDTENGSADLYSHLGDYNVLPLSAPFSPERYVEAIRSCEKAGMEAIIIDSISHEWDGKGGCLEIVESLGGKYQDWAKVTPRHQAFVDAILQSPSHILTTVRRKQDYEMTKVDGRMKVEKGGLKEITREGFEYELTINLELDTRHMASASKDRTNLFAGKASFVPDEKTGELIADWCENGEEQANQVKPGSEWYGKIDACTTQKELVALYNENRATVDVSPLLQQLIANRRNVINGKLSTQAPPPPAVPASTVTQTTQVTTTMAPDLKDWQTKVDACKIKKELVKLYNENKAAVDASAEMKSIMTKRQEAIAAPSLKPADIKAWEERFLACKELAALTALYEANKAFINQNNQLVELFSERRNELNNGQGANAEKQTTA